VLGQTEPKTTRQTKDVSLLQLVDAQWTLTHVAVVQGYRARILVHVVFNQASWRNVYSSGSVHKYI
jgi:hypothetical protein